MKRILVFLLFATFSSQMFSQWNYLQIQHPQQTWRYGQGTIDQAVVSIKPKGNYQQHDLYLTFSAKDLGFTSSDSVEIQMDFSLPKEAIVSDLWLWIDNTTIMRGIILDRWTASNIYENIVKRRRDPALLMKNSAVQYSLRIYPMQGDKSRKIKISYLLPVSFTGGNAQVPIATNILRLSKNTLSKTTVLYWNTPEFTNPRFDQIASGFESSTRWDTATSKTYYYGEISPLALQSDLMFSTSTKSQSVFLGRYIRPDKVNEGYFLLSFNPSNIFNITTAQKITFLFEFDEAKSANSTLSLINNLKSFMMSNLTAKDSFNLIFSGAQIKRMKTSGWYGGDSATIETVFNTITQNMLQNASNMQALITDGIDFIRTNGNKGVLWLVAGSDSYNHHSIANPAITSITSLLKPNIPIFVTDISNWSVVYSYFNSRYYYGNDYFYENLTRQSGSVFTSYRQNSILQSNFATVFDQIRGTIQSFDMITRIENGFCSNRFTNFSTTSSDVPIDRTITQVGKFNGTFPFVLEIAGIYKGSTLTTKVTIHDSSVVNVDEALETIWAGNQILSLESLPQSNSNTKTILDASLTYRVLSKYSAFLALEPSDTLPACITCRDESKLVFVGNRENPLIPNNDSLLYAYPNPFNPETKLKVRLPNGVTSSSATLQIFNVLGQRVKTFDVSSLKSESFTEIVWNGESDAGVRVTSGVYFAVLSTPVKRSSLKLLMMK
ncbi:MAG: T9SS type A sorting domain-containing protein [Ignavibacteriales bacterium]|nr:T9SS type A sorting domain-containing protein [Ignavibacteriales bacterium]